MPRPLETPSPTPQNGDQALIWEKLSTPPTPAPGVWGDEDISWRHDLGPNSLSSYALVLLPPHNPMDTPGSDPACHPHPHLTQTGG